jgi:hypothetical protein
VAPSGSRPALIWPEQRALDLTVFPDCIGPHEGHDYGNGQQGRHGTSRPSHAQIACGGCTQTLDTPSSLPSLHAPLTCSLAQIRITFSPSAGRGRATAPWWVRTPRGNSARNPYLALRSEYRPASIHRSMLKLLVAGAAMQQFPGKHGQHGGPATPVLGCPFPSRGRVP